MEIDSEQQKEMNMEAVAPARERVVARPVISERALAALIVVLSMVARGRSAVAPGRSAGQPARLADPGRALQGRRCRARTAARSGSMVEGSAACPDSSAPQVRNRRRFGAASIRPPRHVAWSPGRISISCSHASPFDNAHGQPAPQKERPRARRGAACRPRAPETAGRRLRAQRGVLSARAGATWIAGSRHCSRSSS